MEAHTARQVARSNEIWLRLLYVFIHFGATAKYLCIWNEYQELGLPFGSTADELADAADSQKATKNPLIFGKQIVQQAEQIMTDGLNNVCCL